MGNKIMKFEVNKLQKILKKILITNLLLASILLSADAETTPLATSIAATNSNAANNSEAEINSTTIDSKVDSNLEISFPIKNKDFLIFYGVTDDKNLNSDVSDLRKDFIENFLILKNDYETKLQEKLGEKKLITPTILDNKNEKDNEVSTSSVNKKVTKISNVKKIKITSNVNVLKSRSDKDDLGISSSTKAETVIIDPIVNLLNVNGDKSKDFDGTIKIENKGWFGKLKAWFR